MTVLLYILFFLSGAAALVYQVVWVRSFGLVFGGSHLAVTTVLSVFMGGLALGGWLVGRKVDQVRRPCGSTGCSSWESRLRRSPTSADGGLPLPLRPSCEARRGESRRPDRDSGVVRGDGDDRADDLDGRDASGAGEVRDRCLGATFEATLVSLRVQHVGCCRGDTGRNLRASRAARGERDARRGDRRQRSPLDCWPSWSPTVPRLRSERLARATRRVATGVPWPAEDADDLVPTGRLPDGPARNRRERVLRSRLRGALDPDSQPGGRHVGVRLCHDAGRLPDRNRRGQSGLRSGGAHGRVDSRHHAVGAGLRGRPGRDRNRRPRRDRGDTRPADPRDDLPASLPGEHGEHVGSAPADQPGRRVRLHVRPGVLHGSRLPACRNRPRRLPAQGGRCRR